jgi:hypothetical protein
MVEPELALLVVTVGVGVERPATLVLGGTVEAIFGSVAAAASRVEALA